MLATLAFYALLASSVNSQAPNVTVSTVARNIISAYIGKPDSLAVDSAGNIYTTDYQTDKIYAISPAGTVSTYAGSNVSGFRNGAKSKAAFFHPKGLAFDQQGNVYVADSWNHAIRKISRSGIVTTLAGTGKPGYLDGPAANATFQYPTGLAIDSAGNVYVADRNNLKIRKISSSGFVSTLAGTKSAMFQDGAIKRATFFYPEGVAVDKAGNVYVADTENNRIRKISSSGYVTTLAGTGNFGSLDGPGVNATFSYPNHLVLDSAGNIYVTDLGNKIRKITPNGVVSTLAGSDIEGSQDGSAADATFHSPSGLAIDSSGNIYVGVRDAIRKISFACPQGLRYDPARGTCAK